MVMQRDLVTANVLDTPEDVATKVARFDLLAIPLAFTDHHMLGIITHDDVLDVMVAEATEDAHRMGGVAPLEEDVLTASFIVIWRKRAGWLSLLFVAGFSPSRRWHVTKVQSVRFSR
jgi:magnesium transporter